MAGTVKSTDRSMSRSVREHLLVEARHLNAAFQLAQFTVPSWLIHL
jgi:hypothetical protein